MKKEIITQVREAEERAERTIQDTHSEAEQILRDARHQALEHRHSILAQAKQEATRRFEQGAKTLEPEVADIHQQAEAALSDETQKAHTHLDAVVEFVVTTFYKHFGNG